MVELSYPEHKHPHGIEDKPKNTQRIWVCEECGCIFTDSEIRLDSENKLWGHNCKSCPKKSPYRCESHLESYLPEIEEGNK